MPQATAPMLRLATAVALAVCGTQSVSAQSMSIPDSLPPGVTRAMVERGREVYQGEGLCAKCHGPEAGGYLGPNLTSPEWWHAEGSYLALIRQILVGVPN